MATYPLARKGALRALYLCFFTKSQPKGNSGGVNPSSEHALQAVFSQCKVCAIFMR